MLDGAHRERLPDMGHFVDKIQMFSRTSFIALLRSFLEKIGVQRVCFSNAPIGIPAASESENPRIDIVLSGVKRLQYRRGNRVENELLTPGTLHYDPPHCGKLALWTEVHEMSSIVILPKFVRVTYIDNDHPMTQGTQSAKYFYHTIHQPSGEIRQLCAILNRMAGLADPSHASVSLTEAMIKLVLNELEQDSQNPLGKRRITWLRIENYISENFRQPLTREQVASAHGLSPGYLSQLFAAEAHESFTEYMRRLRMEYATGILGNSNDTIEAIAERCGYQSSTSFIAMFREHFGMPPGQYRERHRCPSPAQM